MTDNKLYDIVIPVGQNDIQIIHDLLVYLKTNIIGYRNIYIVTPISNINFTDCIIINDNIYPFSIKDVETYYGKSYRCGWYLQQLIKLYSGFVIPDIMKNYLVIDADLFFIKPCIFIENDKFLFNTGVEYNVPYFEHMKKLHPSLKRVDPKISGITHHMLFNSNYILELFKLVENEHNNEEFWRVFLKSVEPNCISGASEYEIYFNYMLIYHSDKIKIRKLNYIETSRNKFGYYCNEPNLDYIACHYYIR